MSVLLLVRKDIVSYKCGVVKQFQNANGNGNEAWATTQQMQVTSQKRVGRRHTGRKRERERVCEHRFNITLLYSRIGLHF